MILRKPLKVGFTIIPNQILHDKSLKMADRGLLCTLYSLPDGWNLSGAGLAEILPESKDAIWASLRRLEGSGYISRTQERGGDGKMGAIICELLIPEKPENTAFLPHTEKPCTEKAPQYNNNKYIDDDDTRARERDTLEITEPDPMVEDIISALEAPEASEEHIPIYDPMIRAIASRIYGQKQRGRHISDIRAYVSACVNNYRVAPPPERQHDRYISRPGSFSKKPKKSGFHNFVERNNDYAELERLALKQGG